MSEESEIVSLLREIRDLQREHFEQYKQFTSTALQRQEEAAERQQQLAANTAQARQADQQYRTQVQQNLVDARRSAVRTRVIVWISVVLQGALVFALGCIILALLKR